MYVKNKEAVETIADVVESVASSLSGMEFDSRKRALRRCASRLRDIKEEAVESQRQYIQQLEEKVRQLEAEQRQMAREAANDDEDEITLPGFVPAGISFQKVEQSKVPGIVSVRKVRFK